MHTDQPFEKTFENSLQSTSLTAANDTQATEISVFSSVRERKKLNVAYTLSCVPVADYPSAANTKQEYEAFQLEIAEINRPFARPGHMVQN